MNQAAPSSGPILQLLANGLNLWIRRQCDEVGDLNLVLKGSALQLLRGRLDGVELDGCRISFQGLPIQRASVRSSALNLNLKPQQRGQILQLQNRFQLCGSVTMGGIDLNRALASERWRWLGEWLAEHLLGLSSLGSFEIDHDTLVLQAPLNNEGNVICQRFRLDAQKGTLRISCLEGDESVLVPMDSNIHIEEAHLSGGLLEINGTASVTP